MTDSLIHTGLRKSQAHPWHGVPAHSQSPGVYHSFIEIVPTDTVKYELDKPSGLLRVDRPQRFSSLCPTLYGFIPQTYSAEEVAKRCMDQCNMKNMQGDADPLDVCIVTEKAFAHGNFLCNVHPIGGFRVVDKNQVDDKIIAVLEADLAFGHLRELHDCADGLIERLKHYFLTYKQEPGDEKRSVHIVEAYGREEALTVIRCGMIDYQKHYGLG